MGCYYIHAAWLLAVCILSNIFDGVLTLQIFSSIKRLIDEF